MALVTSDFAGRYAELVSRVPTLTERLLDVQRCEACERRDVEAQAAAAFQDVLHVRAVMIADKRARQYGAAAHMDEHALALYKRETAVWFPAAPPRIVPFRANRPLRAFPHAAFRELCDEERELRQWLYGVERRLRQNIEEACGRSWFVLNVMDDTKVRESRERQGIQKDEDADITLLRQRFFRTVPADYFRTVVVARYGTTVAAAAEDASQEAPLETQEQTARAAMYGDEEESRRTLFTYLHNAYDVRLFALNHQEVVQRYDIEQAQVNSLYPLVSGLCRADFGFTFYHVPALSLHLSAACPTLRQLCLQRSQEQHRYQQWRRQVSPPPPPPPPRTAGAPPHPPPPLDFGVSAAEQEAHSGGAPPAVEDTHPQFPTPPPAALPVVENTVATEESEPAAVAAAEAEKEEKEEEEKERRRKEWEVNSKALAKVHETVVTYEAAADANADGGAQKPLSAESAEQTPVEEQQAAEAGEEATTLEHHSSTLTCSPQPLPGSVFSCIEIFVGDPFATTPKKDKKAKKGKKHKKSSKSSKSKRSKSDVQ